ncbi:hypothetical protein F3F96_03950 [Mariprofundus sp. NF]|uniref:hypothetical protein n=1 Tax=Mariprofundus sp. NF TaxID=2608716 RepID=UPI0015A30DD9|nr:hypothetical protein [Mariprofundus sp. NF]NWF38283.1 hypothetical protein [Mariprofundus sp. NF]
MPNTPPLEKTIALIQTYEKEGKYDEEMEMVIVAEKSVAAVFPDWFFEIYFSILNSALEDGHPLNDETRGSCFQGAVICFAKEFEG